MWCSCCCWQEVKSCYSSSTVQLSQWALIVPYLHQGTKSIELKVRDYRFRCPGVALQNWLQRKSTDDKWLVWKSILIERSKSPSPLTISSFIYYVNTLLGDLEANHPEPIIQSQSVNQIFQATYLPNAGDQSFQTVFELTGRPINKLVNRAVLKAD